MNFNLATIKIKNLRLRTYIGINEDEIKKLEKMLKDLEKGKKTPGKGFAKIKIKQLIADLKSGKIKTINISTKPYPGFPTDLQAQLMVLMTCANGISRIRENIFENRFMHVPELKRMGADIKIKDRTAIIKGPSKLTGAEVMATDLRASVSLVLAALVAENKTIINRIYHLDRGYENLEKKLKNCEASIKRI